LENESKREEENEYDEDDDMDDIDTISFWPSAEEFKDLLLDESRFRVEVAGDWVAPLGYLLLNFPCNNLFFILIQYSEGRDKMEV